MMVPIEVGIGKKTKSQLTKSINKYDSEYGVLISNRYSTIQQHNNIIHIPLLWFFMSFGYVKLLGIFEKIIFFAF